MVAVLYRFAEERLGLLWRSWLTRKVTEHYLDGRTYLRLKESAEIDNPDQRIAEDIRAFTTTTLSFSLIILNSTLAAISFSGVLWTISPLLFVVAVGYAALGTLTTVLLGRPLVGLNYRQSDREADFRSALIHVGENAESIALLRREDRLRARLMRRIDELVENSRRITSVNRNLGFFTTGYNYLIQIIPALIVAPRFIRGEVEFGVITQSTMAFTQLLGAFSLFINQVGSITSFAAVVARLSELGGAVETMDADGPGIETVEDNGRVAYERLTLRSPRDDAPLAGRGLGVDPPGMRRAGHGPERGRPRRPLPGDGRGLALTGKGGSSARPWTRSSSCPSSRTCPRARSGDILIPPGPGRTSPTSGSWRPSATAAWIPSCSGPAGSAPSRTGRRPSRSGSSSSSRSPASSSEGRRSPSWIGRAPRWGGKLSGRPSSDSPPAPSPTSVSSRRRGPCRPSSTTRC